MDQEKTQEPGIKADFKQGALEKILPDLDLSKEQKKKAEQQIKEAIAKVENDKFALGVKIGSAIKNEELAEDANAYQAGLVQNQKQKMNLGKRLNQAKTQEAVNYQEVLRRNQEALQKRQEQQKRQQMLKQKQQGKSGMLDKAKKINEARKMVTAPQNIATKPLKKIIKNIPVVGAGVGAFAGVIGAASAIVILLE